MKAVVIALAALAVLIAPAYSQGKKGKAPGNAQQIEEQKRKKAQAAQAERASKAQLDRMPDQKFDPWGGVR